MLLPCAIRQSSRISARLATQDTPLAAPDADDEASDRQARAMKTLLPITILLAVTSTSTGALAFETSTTPVQRESDGTTAEDSAKPRNDSAAYSAVRGQELMLNAFRSPSIGLEYRVAFLSLHVGAYPTIVNEGETMDDGTTWFAKAGASAWFLPVHILGNERSSFYGGLSYVNDFGRDGWGHGAQVEAGFRLVFFKGLFARLGASALYAPGRTCPASNCEVVKVRPNPAIGWAFAID
jgi:hypothetical protein